MNCGRIRFKDTWHGFPAGQCYGARLVYQKIGRTIPGQRSKSDDSDIALNDKRKKSVLDHQTCRLICPIAAAMVGVCLTGISLLHIVNIVRKTNTLADDLLSVDAVLFLIATFASYFALRVSTERRLHHFERFADGAFILAMTLLTLICIFITYALNV